MHRGAAAAAAAASAAALMSDPDDGDGHEPCEKVLLYNLAEYSPNECRRMNIRRNEYSPN